MSKSPVKIHLGCGSVILKGWVNVDVAALEGVDVVHDLNKLPLPFEDESADEILAQDVFEHLDDYPAVLKDCHRILVPGGKIHLEMPHFTASNNHVDPTHKNTFSIKTFDFFAADTYEGKYRSYYFDFKFSRIESRRLIFKSAWWLFFNRPLEWLFNLSYKFLLIYEATGLCYMFPALNVKVTLVK